MGTNVNADVGMTQAAERMSSKWYASDCLWYGGSFCQSGPDVMEMGHTSLCMTVIPLSIGR